MIKFLRAFWQALRLTLRGETLTPTHFHPLEIWIEAGLGKLTAVFETAEADAVDLDALQLRIDGRMTSLERTLQMARHNLVNEYPRLIRLDDPYSMMVVQSSNMNDQYRVSQFLAADVIQSEALKRALADLDTHLLTLPSIDRPEPQD